MGQTGDARVKHIADIGIHPLYRTGTMKQETFHKLLEAAKTIHGKIYTDQASSHQVNRLGEILTSTQKGTAKIYRMLVIQQYTRIKHPNTKTRWVTAFKVRQDGRNVIRPHYVNLAHEYGVNTENMMTGLNAIMNCHYRI